MSSGPIKGQNHTGDAHGYSPVIEPCQQQILASVQIHLYLGPSFHPVRLYPVRFVVGRYSKVNPMRMLHERLNKSPTISSSFCPASGIAHFPFDFLYLPNLPLPLLLLLPSISTHCYFPMSW
jgi:hypothetical protein